VSAQREREERVSPVELFFDLVFVFGFTQVTTVLSNNPTSSGLEHALLLLVALWWAWEAYAWLTNAVDPSDGFFLGTMMIAMGAMFVAALAVPEAFGRHGVVFGVAFFIVAAMQLLLYALAARGDKDLLNAILRIAPSALTGSVLILAAGFADGWMKALLWWIALAVGFFGPLFVDPSGWRVQPAHFVERHGLIVIIAIGESLVAIGIGARGTGLGASVIVAAVLGFFIAASFWLAYFDFFTTRAQQLLADRSGTRQTALARDTYSYLHLPMVVGIVLFAFGLKTTLAHVGHELAAIPALCLCGGPALYLLGYVGIRARVSHQVRGGRFIAAIACAALVPVALTLPAMVALACVATVWAALHVYELIWWRDARAETRALRARVSASSPRGSPG
jgi:low temperature requirement protein LtrA